MKTQNTLKSALLASAAFAVVVPTMALAAIKGSSIAEIARMRGTKDGTIKAQLNAIYRKAGVTGRPQLISFFIDEMVDGIAPTA